MKQLVLICIAVLATIGFRPAEPTYRIGLLKYSGGGDWYANLDTSLPNLIKFCNQQLKTNIDIEQGIWKWAVQSCSTTRLFT